MIDRYTAELDAPVLPLAPGSRGPGVKRAQEWLGLHGRGVVIDADYGPATARAVDDFQRAAGLPGTGEVDAATWRALTADLATAAHGALPEMTFGAAIVAIAQGYLHAAAREIGGDNKGPWVRHVCRGYEVAWCQGAVSTWWADAARLLGREPPLELVLDGIWCLFVPRMVTEAHARGHIAAGERVTPTPGSMFFLRGGQYGYQHVGIVEVAHGDGTMTTLEGNTNEGGSANGYEVARRVRRTAGCDFAMVAA